MTNPLPESAVELAVRLATTATATPRDTCLDHEEYAEAIIRAALPAIREAVVGELKVGLLRETLERAEEYLPVAPERNCSCHLSPPCGDCVDFSDLRDLHETIRAALTEQENRHDER